MLLKTRGIVFRTVKYGETSVIADIFTEEKGLHTFIGGGVRTAKSRMPFNLFQPMTVVDMVSYFKDSPDALNRIKEIRADTVYQRIPFDIKRGVVALFMAEVCRKSIQEKEENRDLFDYLWKNTQWLDSTTLPIANLHLHFLLHLSTFLGFQPVVETAQTDAAFFDVKEGIFTTEQPLHGHAMNGVQTCQMLNLMEVSLEECHNLPLTRTDRKQLLDKLLLFFQLHVPNFGTLNTTEVLETVF